MVSLKLQKRLAASVLKCGTRKIWMDPNEVWISRFCNATSPFAPFGKCFVVCVGSNARSRLSNDPVPSKLVLLVLHDEHDIARRAYICTLAPFVLRECSTAVFFRFLTEKPFPRR